MMCLSCALGLMCTDKIGDVFALYVNVTRAKHDSVLIFYP